MGRLGIKSAPASGGFLSLAAGRGADVGFSALRGDRKTDGIEAEQALNSEYVALDLVPELARTSSPENWDCRTKG